MTAIILDYNTSEVDVVSIPKELEQLKGDDIIANLQYNLSEVCYMICTSPTIHFDTPSLNGLLTLE